MSKKKPDDPARTIARNRRVRHDYQIEETFEAGLALQGWEVKSLRAGRAQINEAYVIVQKGEVWLLGAHIDPLRTASSHVDVDPTRTRKLLLHAREISRLIGAVERSGYTLVPIDMHWTRGRVKIEIGLAKGKKKHDQRADIKDREWKRDQARLLRQRG